MSGFAAIVRNADEPVQRRRCGWSGEDPDGPGCGVHSGLCGVMARPAYQVPLNTAHIRGLAASFPGHRRRTCHTSDQSCTRGHEPTSQPFCPYGIHAVRAAAGTECRILAWITAPMSSILRTFGPEGLGGLGDLQGKIEAEAQKTGKPAPAVAMSVRDGDTYGSCLFTSGSARSIAGALERSCAYLGYPRRMTTRLTRRRYEVCP
jgi:hypothetical protein